MTDGQTDVKVIAVTLAKKQRTGIITVSKEGRYSEAEGDDGQTVEVDEEEDGERIRVVDDGAVPRWDEENSGDEDAADRHRC